MKKKAILISSILGVIFIIIGYLINYLYHKKIKSNPVVFVYQTLMGPANSVLLIEDIEYKNDLITYYKLIEADSNANPYFNFPLKTLPVYEPVFLIGYTDDSSLAEIVSYYDRGGYLGGNYLRGWVYYKTIHNNPPTHF